MYEVVYIADSTRLAALYALQAPDGLVVASTDQGYRRCDLVSACSRLNRARVSA
jgi:hypothetical protein